MAFFISVSFATNNSTSCVWSMLDIFWCFGAFEFSMSSLWRKNDSKWYSRRPQYSHWISEHFTLQLFQCHRRWKANAPSCSCVPTYLVYLKIAFSPEINSTKIVFEAQILRTVARICVYRKYCGLPSDIYIGDVVPIESRLKLATNVDILFQLQSNIIENPKLRIAFYQSGTNVLGCYWFIVSFLLSFWSKFT